MQSVTPSASRVLFWTKQKDILSLRYKSLLFISFSLVPIYPNAAQQMKLCRMRRSWDGITDILKEQRNIFSTSTVTHVFYSFHEMTWTVQKWHLPSILQYITKCSDFTHKSSTEAEQWDTSSVFFCFQSVLGMVATGQGQEQACPCSLSAKGDGDPSTLPSTTRAGCFKTILLSPHFKII